MGRSHVLYLALAGPEDDEGVSAALGREGAKWTCSFCIHVHGH